MASHLVLDQTNEWGNDDGDSTAQKRWQLVAQALTCRTVSARVGRLFPYLHYSSLAGTEDSISIHVERHPQRRDSPPPVGIRTKQSTPDMVALIACRWFSLQQRAPVTDHQHLSGAPAFQPFICFCAVLATTKKARTDLEMCLKSLLPKKSCNRRLALMLHGKSPPHRRSSLPST